MHIHYDPALIFGMVNQCWELLSFSTKFVFLDHTFVFNKRVGNPQLHLGYEEQIIQIHHQGYARRGRTEAKDIDLAVISPG